MNDVTRSVTSSTMMLGRCDPSTLIVVKVENDEDACGDCGRSQENLPSEAHIESNRIAENYSVKELARELHQFQRTGYLCDTILVAEDGQLKAHSAVLAAASPLLKSSLKMTGSPVTHVIVLPGIKLHILEIIVHFIYTGDVVIPANYSSYKDFSALILATMVELGLKVTKSANRRNIPGFAGPTDNCTVIVRGNTATVFNVSKVYNNSGNHLSPAKQTSCSIRQVQVDAEHGNRKVPVTTKTSSCSSIQSVRHAAAAPPAQLPSPGVLNVLGGLTKQPQRVDKNVANTSEHDSTRKESYPDSSSSSPEYVTTVNSSGRIVIIQTIKPKNLRNENCLPGKQLCEYCGKFVTCHKMLKDHLTTHTGSFQFACQECGKRFAYRHRYKEHMFKHSDQQTLRCKACREVFTDVESFRKHKDVVHRDSAKKKRNLKECLVCRRTFCDNWNLSQHMRSHTGEKPFECTMCPRRFVMKQGLQWHMRRHTGETPYLCQDCGRSFSQPSGYYGHMVKLHGYVKKPRRSRDKAQMVKNATAGSSSSVQGHTFSDISDSV